MSETASRQMLRHTLATVAYRAGKTLRGAPAGFADYRAAETLRTPLEILAHLGDLMEWALGLARGESRWPGAAPLPWEEEKGRFYAAVARFDAFLASGEELACAPEKLFQGPVADALNHVGQIALLRRMSGAPIRGENYFVADIAAGRVSPEQAAPRREFD
jgi:hypothetical protein